MTDSRTDLELLDAIRSSSSSDRTALEALLERHEAEIWRFGLKMCASREDAKDVLQETMIAAARTAGDFRGDSSVPTWLYAIARSFCIKKRRRGKFAPAAHLSLDDDADAAGAIAAEGAPPDEVAATREIGRELERAIDDLEASQREVLLLRDVEGLTAPEVGKVLGLRVDAVKSRLHRARVAVRERLAPLLEGAKAGAGRPSGAAGGCPDIVPVFSRYVEGEIGLEECARMQEHVASCPRCSAACDSLKQTLTLCQRRGRAGRVPADVQALVRKALQDLAEGQRP